MDRYGPMKSTKCRMCSVPVYPKEAMHDGMCNDCVYQAYKHWRRVAHIVVKEVLNYDKLSSDRFKDVQ